MVNGDLVPISFNRGSESHILNSNPKEGNVWVATDTGKIFLSTNETFMPIGANVRIFYAQKTWEETPGEGQDKFDFNFEDLLGVKSITNEEESSNAVINNIPSLNDLILNTDGCFYKVFSLDIDNQTLIGQQLTLAGTGGGGTTPGGGTSYASATLTPLSQSKEYMKGDPCDILFRFKVIEADGSMSSAQQVATIKVGTSSSVNGAIKKDTVKLTPSDAQQSLSVQNYLSDINETQYVFLEIAVDIGDGNTITLRRSWQFNQVTINTTWNFDEEEIITGNTIPISFSTSGIRQKTTHILFDDKEIKTLDYNITTQQNYELTKDDIGNAWTQGLHIISLYTILIINGIETSTEIYSHAVIIKIDNDDTIILGTKTTELNISQYDIATIRFFIWDPTKDLNEELTVKFLIDDNIVAYMDTIKNGNFSNWSHLISNADTTTLGIGYENVTITVPLNVTALPISTKEVSGWDFKLNAGNFSSADEFKKYVQNPENTNITVSDNFNWETGGLQLDNEDPYICIKSGTSLTIDTNFFNNISNNQSIAKKGRSLKLIFKAVNCKEYDGAIGGIIGELDEPRLDLKIQSADLIIPPNGREITDASAVSTNVQYCEDSKIELEFDIWPSDKNQAEYIGSVPENEKFIMAWIDGTPAYVNIYNSEANFISEHSQLVLGSDKCDLYIYLIKTYNKHLTDIEHLNNFIMDASNSTEMYNRFKRNNILDSDLGVISYSKLVDANPNCRVHLYEISRMTQNKSDKIKNCSYKQYYQTSLIPYIEADNTTISVQGTSSARYGVSAYNFDTKFDTSFKVEDKTTSKWAMDDNAIPVNYFNTKVNVASAENANNAINQEWYNRFQPFITRWRAKNEKARDTMQFQPGVVFIKDNNHKINSTSAVENNLFKEFGNKYIDTSVETNKAKYYQQYAICNMGNSKKNSALFHDPDNIYEVCVENHDNTTDGNRMTTLTGGQYKSAEELIINPDTGETTTSTVQKVVSVTLIPTREQINAVDNSIVLNENNYPNNNGFIETTELNYFLENISSSTGVSNFYNLNNFNYSDLLIYLPNDFNNLTADQQGAWLINFNEEVDFSFRYLADEEDKEIQKAGAAAWYRVVYWMAKNNPNAYTDRVLNNGDGISYDAYTYKGYTAAVGIGDEEPYSPTRQILKGNSELSRQTYYTDSKEYRIAKMLHECEDYLIMDSIVYHFLFIERHTMIDNVAKNTFWSTEDLVHWQLTKDYDNDTADGINNDGLFAFNYGEEPYNINGTSVFNAPGSVWLVFINGLFKSCQKVYNELSTAWDVNNYLNYFTNWQNTIPEICWIEDSYRKYLRPWTIYGDSQYLIRLAGGKKTYQRKQFEIYQNAYLNSKYATNDTVDSNSLAGRLGTSVNDVLSLTPYIDCYGVVQIGGQPNKQKVYHNTTTNFTIQTAADAHVNINGTSLDGSLFSIYPARWLSKIGNLLPLKVQTWPTTIAEKITELHFGDYDSSTNNNAIKGLTFRNYPLLEKLYLNHYTAFGELDLTTNDSLQIVQALDSGCTACLFPDGAPLTSIELEKPTSLRLTNLINLTIFNINNYGDLTTLYLDNIDNNNIIINNQKLSQVITTNTINSAGNKFNTYNLLNINWIIQNANECFIDEYLSINILEALANVASNNPNRNHNLSGTLEITGNAFNGTGNAASDEIIVLNTINHYLELFPNLQIIFTGSSVKTVVVNFYNGDEISIIKTKVLLNKDVEANYAWLTQSDINKIKKDQTNVYTYAFNEQWYLEDDLTHNNSNKTISTIFNENRTIKNEINLYPKFNQEYRIYNLKFYNGSTLLETNGDPHYNDNILDFQPLEIPYSSNNDNNNLLLYEFYDFAYYQDRETGEILDINSKVLKDNVIYDAVFTHYDGTNDSIRKYPHPEFFDLTAEGRLSPKVNLTGKIVIPSLINNITVRYLTGFDGMTAITHLFLENSATCEITTIESECFKNCNNLIHFEFPNQLTNIGDEAFRNCNLINPVFNTGLKTIGNNSFNASITISSNSTFRLPYTLEAVGSYGLAHINNDGTSDSLSTSILVVGESDHYSRLYSLGNKAFAQNYSNKFKDLEYYGTDTTILNALYAVANDTSSEVS